MIHSKSSINCQELGADLGICASQTEIHIAPRVGSNPIERDMDGRE